MINTLSLELGPFSPHFRHVKRGTLYRNLFYAFLYTGPRPVADETPLLFALDRNTRSYVLLGPDFERTPGHLVFATTVTLQTLAPLKQGSRLMVYAGEDARLWARSPTEMKDGRFQNLTVEEKTEWRRVQAEEDARQLRLFEVRDPPAKGCL